MNNAITHDPISRRTFLKLAAGTAAGAMLFKVPFTASAKEAAAAMEIHPICNLRVARYAVDHSGGGITMEGWMQEFIGSGLAARLEVTG